MHLFVEGSSSRIIFRVRPDGNADRAALSHVFCRTDEGSMVKKLEKENLLRDVETALQNLQEITWERHQIRGPTVEYHRTSNLRRGRANHVAEIGRYLGR